MSERTPCTPSAGMANLLDVPMGEMKALVQATRTRTLAEEEIAKLDALIETMAFMQAHWQGQGPDEDRSATIKKLLTMIFGARTEKTRAVLDKMARKAGEAVPEQAETGEPEKKKRKPPEKGHGRNGVAAFTGAKKEQVEHPDFKDQEQGEEKFKGRPCPQEGCEGRVYLQNEPKTLIRMTGVAPLSATVYELDRWRCNLCGKVHTAPAPEGVGEDKYDAKSVATIGLLKYDIYLPFARIEKLQACYGVPMPASSQWGVIEEKTPVLRFVHEALITGAGNARLIHGDDTTMRVLGMSAQERADALSEGLEGSGAETPESGAAGTSAKPKRARTGIYTSGILATTDGHEIVLFFTGPKYAGENLTTVLNRRDKDLPPPIYMCDGLLSRNLPKQKTELVQCNVHARRGVLEQAENFPNEVRFVLEIFTEIYATDDKAKEGKLNDEERLALHQKESGPRMEALRAWIDEQFEKKLVEPNSGLGKSLTYITKRWEQLCGFLSIPGCPLDNNPAEQILRGAVQHRVASLYYRTLNGASVGDCWMSVIKTAGRAGVNEFDYLVALLEHPKEVEKDPNAWLPWTYIGTLAEIEESAARAR